MAERKNYITPRGFKRLQREHEHLRGVERPRVVDEVAWAASLGDRSENAEYIYGKKRLREIDKRLEWLASRIDRAEVVDPAIDRGDRIFFGATVTVAYPDGEEATYTLIGEDETDTGRNWISWRSPMGRTLLRRREGEEVVLQHAGRQTELEIVEVAYEPLEPDEPAASDAGSARTASSG